MRSRRGPVRSRRGPGRPRRGPGRSRRGPGRSGRAPMRSRRGPMRSRRGPGRSRRGSGGPRRGPGRSRKGPMRSRSGPGRSRRGPGRPRRGGVNIDRVRDGQFWPVTKCSSRNMWMCFFYCILFYHITNITYELLLLKFCRYCHFQLNYNNIYFKRFFCKNICAILWTNFFI